MRTGLINGAWAQKLIPVDVTVRVIAEYDANYLEDRIRADVMVGGFPAGAYAVRRVEDGLASSAYLRNLVDHDSEHLAEMAVHEWLDGPRKMEVRLLQEIDALRTQVAINARPLWRKAYEWILGISR